MKRTYYFYDDNDKEVGTITFLKVEDLGDPYKDAKDQLGFTENSFSYSEYFDDEF